MRHLISAICILGVLGAPASALAAANRADLRDARCIAAMGVMAQKNTKKSDEWIITAAMVYSLGRLEGRSPTFDLAALVREALEDEDEASLMGRAATCVDAMSDAMKAIEALDRPESRR